MFDRIRAYDGLREGTRPRFAPYDDRMRITVNGDCRDIDAGWTVADLLGHLDLGDRPCAVEVNRSVIPHRQHDQHILGPEDAVEVVTLVGGG